MRQVSRRHFLKFCTTSAACLGLGPFDITGLQKALANPAGPSVLWLQGSGCTGCTMSFLNYVSPTAPLDAADVLINYINLAYHPNLSPIAGESVVSVVRQIRDAGNFILAPIGGRRTARFNLHQQSNDYAHARYKARFAVGWTGQSTRCRARR